ncbi:MAG: TetR/AcrR family transcriptional regulator [Corynebacteriales bacterium]|nr:TetR/AcrR family transcriptional regulator [Mycobacteriales bacterium]
MSQQIPLREQLINLGVELVTTDGVAALGLREIARRAGVSHGAPRRYFPTHHSLLSAIAQRGFADHGAQFTAATRETDSARAQLRALSHTYVEYAVRNRGMFELMFRHELLDSERHTSNQPRLRESTIPLFTHIVSLVADCHIDSPPKRPAPLIAAALWANLHGIAQLWLWGSLQIALTDSIDTPNQLIQLIDTTIDSHLGPVGS